MSFAVFESVAAMWLLAVVTPGPNFLAAARVAAARGRSAGLAAVAGIGFGTMLWGLAGCFGVHAVFSLVPWLYGALKMLAACYLIVVGVRIVLGSFAPETAAAAVSPGPAFRLGLLTSISNPKSALLVSSLFAAVLPPDAPLSEGLAAVAEMVAISLAWYALVVRVLATPRAAAAYRRLRRAIDRLAGGIFVAFGARLVLERG